MNLTRKSACCIINLLVKAQNIIDSSSVSVVKAQQIKFSAVVKVSDMLYVVLHIVVVFCFMHLYYLLRPVAGVVFTKKLGLDT